MRRGNLRRSRRRTAPRGLNGTAPGGKACLCDGSRGARACAIVTDRRRPHGRELRDPEETAERVARRRLPVGMRLRFAAPGFRLSSIRARRPWKAAKTAGIRATKCSRSKFLKAVAKAFFS